MSFPTKSQSKRNKLGLSSLSPTKKDILTRKAKRSPVRQAVQAAILSAKASRELSKRRYTSAATAEEEAALKEQVVAQNSKLSPQNRNNAIQLQNEMLSNAAMINTAKMYGYPDQKSLQEAVKNTRMRAKDAMSDVINETTKGEILTRKSVKSPKNYYVSQPTNVVSSVANAIGNGVNSALNLFTASPTSYSPPGGGPPGGGPPGGGPPGGGPPGGGPPGGGPPGGGFPLNFIPTSTPSTPNSRPSATPGSSGQSGSASASSYNGSSVYSPPRRRLVPPSFPESSGFIKNVLNGVAEGAYALGKGGLNLAFGLGRSVLQPQPLSLPPTPIPDQIVAPVASAIAAPIRTIQQVLPVIIPAPPPGLPPGYIARPVRRAAGAGRLERAEALRSRLFREMNSSDKIMYVRQNLGIPIQSIAEMGPSIAVQNERIVQLALQKGIVGGKTSRS